MNRKFLARNFILIICLTILAHANGLPNPSSSASLLLNSKFALSNSNVYRLDPIYLMEEPSIGTLIIDLASKLDINDLATSDYKFRFYSPHSLTAHYFLIDQLTGHVKTLRSLDREYLCETKACGPCTNGNNCTLPIEIVVGTYSTMSLHKQQSSAQQKFVSFDVIIEDKNEFAPQFPHQLIVLNISENAPSNFTIPLEPATDRDSRQTSIIYSIVPVQSSLKKNSKSINHIDNEDNGNNDETNSFEFQSDDYRNVFNKNNNQIENYDQEVKRLNSRIRLSTSSMNNGLPSGGGGSGGLQSQSSASSSSFNTQQLNLIIIEPFDYEQEKEINFKILASDGKISPNNNQPVLTGTCLVKIKIIDMNDNLPVFDKQEYEYRLDEDQASAGTRLIRVHATDRDDGLNGLVKYYLVDQTLSTSALIGPTSLLQQQQQQQQQTQLVQIKNLFQIDENTGWISVAPNTNLDYEQIPIYRLTVRAQDCGPSNSMPVYTNVIIYLNDVNDNSPQISLTVPSSMDDFSSGSFNSNSPIESINLLEISEWSLPDTFLAQVVISDLDSGLNGKLRIELTQRKKKTKQTDSKNSTNNNYLPKNSNEPTQINKETWINSDDFTLVHLFNNIYSLMTKQALDREKYDIYSLNITVSDYGQPNSLFSTHQLTIRIKDENDNSPVFVNIPGLSILDENGTVIAYTFNLTEMETSKESNSAQTEWINIGQISAIDNDIDDNARIKYELEPAISATNRTKCNKSVDYVTTLFQIDSKNGLIKAKRFAMDREFCDRYEFKLIAKDNFESVKSKLSYLSNQAITSLIINLIDLNDNIPEFEQSAYNFQVHENIQSLPFKLGTVKAFDSDKANTNFSLVKYKILNKENIFKIDESNGELYLLSPLDYENSTYYELSILAYDNLNLSTSLNSTCLVRVNVLDLNDNPPMLNTPSDIDLPLVFPIDSIIQSNHHTSSLNNLIKLNATDLDTGNYGKLTFKLEKQFKLKQRNVSIDFLYQNIINSNQLSSPEIKDEFAEDYTELYDLKRTIFNQDVNLFECDPTNGLISVRTQFLRRNRPKRSQPTRSANVQKSILLRQQHFNANNKLTSSISHGHANDAIDDVDSDSMISDSYENLIGIYGLVIKISDGGVVLNPRNVDQNNNQDQMNNAQQSTKVYIFIAITKNQTADITVFNKSHLANPFENLIKYQIAYLHRLINETGGLNQKNSEQVEEDNDTKFRRLVTQYTLVNTNKKKSNTKTQYSSSWNGKDSKYQQTQSTNFSKLTDQIMSFINGKNYKYFILFLVIIGVLILFITISLSTSVYIYKKRKEKKTSQEYTKSNTLCKGKKLNAELEKLTAKSEISLGKSKKSNTTSTTLSTSTKTSTLINNSPALDFTSSASSSSSKSNAGSASPSSLTSSELIENSNYLTTSSDENLKKKTKSSNLNEKTSKVVSLREYSSGFVNSSSQQSSTTALIKITRTNKKVKEKQSNGLKSNQIKMKNNKNIINNNNNSSNINKNEPNDSDDTNKKNSDLNTSGEEERAILIVNTNSPTATSSNSSAIVNSTSSSHNALSSNNTESTSNNTTLTITTPSSHQQQQQTSKKYSNINNSCMNGQLMVLVSSSSSSSSSAVAASALHHKKIVASTESLSSLNSNSSNHMRITTNLTTKQKTSTLNGDEKLLDQVLVSSSSSNSSTHLASNNNTNSFTKQQKLLTTATASPNSFKTFKTNYSPNQSSDCRYGSNTISHQDYVNYRTMPVNGYRNLINETTTNSTTNTQSNKSNKATHNFDQKPLNLPVNELFRRYELKRQASSGSLTSVISSLNNTSSHQNQQHQQSQHQQQQRRIIESNPDSKLDYSSPRSYQKQFNLKLINENSPMSTNGQVPDYFFKDEKEYKKFLANNNKQKLNCKHVIELGTPTNSNQN